MRLLPLVSLQALIPTSPYLSLADNPTSRMPHVLRNFPDLTYQGYDAASSVIERIQADKNVTDLGPRVSFATADLAVTSLPTGKDLIFSRDALQHLAMPLILSVLRTFQAAGPAWLMVGSYPRRWSNILIETGGYFPINLAAPPFLLMPSHIHSEGPNVAIDPNNLDHKHM